MSARCVVLRRQPVSDAAKELALVQAAGTRPLTRDERQYPVRLREIYDPAPQLYVRGNVELLAWHSISIVGGVFRRLTGIKWLKGWGATWVKKAW